MIVFNTWLTSSNTQVIWVHW